MAASPQDVQAKLDQVDFYLSKTTSSYAQMVGKHGADWRKWPPTSSWYLALTQLYAARAEVASLSVKVLAAEFSYKES